MLDLRRRRFLLGDDTQEITSTPALWDMLDGV
jgi:hypothetical protein